MTDSTNETTQETQVAGNPGTNLGTDWEAAYKGLQKKLSATQAQAELWKTERDDFSSQLAAVKADLLVASGGTEALTAKATSLEAQVAQLQTQFETTNSALERSKLIMGDYQDLAKFEAKGLLPQAETVDDLKAKLDEFRAALGESVDKSVHKVLDGATPPAEEPHVGDEGLSDDALREKMMAAAGRDNAEYARLQAIADSRDT